MVPICCFAAWYSPYGIDGDSVAYMDIADLLRTHRWAGIVNGYWHPLYPAVLAAGQLLFHPALMNERRVYVMLNWVVFLAQAGAVWLFVGALVRLRERMSPGERPLLSLDAMRLLGVGVLMASALREMDMGKIRPDGLLQALLLMGFATMLQVLATEKLWFAPLMGLFFGLAYLTKSFAFVVALLSILVMIAFQRWMEQRPWRRVLLSGALAGVVFAAVAGPYMAALSLQKHRLDFGDSGSLNFAWYSAGTQKMHLELGQTERFGSASVRLVHPVPRLLDSPPIYSYKALPYGTYPDWFDPTYFNERIVPHVNLRYLLPRDMRNVVLVGRYLMNHPEAWVLLVALLLCGARMGFTDWRRQGFWLPMVLLGLAMWAIYGLVNIEERYVTVAYLAVILPVFAALTTRAEVGDGIKDMASGMSGMQRVAAGMVALLAFLTLSYSVLGTLENRRYDVYNDDHAQQQYGTAQGLEAMGVRPGDEIACMEIIACVFDPYWARLTEVRVLTEVFNSGAVDLLAQLEGLPNRQQVYDVVKAQGAKVLVAYFQPGTMVKTSPAAAGWERLGATNFYALRLNLPVLQAIPAVQPSPWTADNMKP
jgi:4-amino-4-deoxy-L-arabinose transferase-like glycosyltransferase